MFTREIETSQNLTSAQQENTFWELCFCSQIISFLFISDKLSESVCFGPSWISNVIGEI